MYLFKLGRVMLAKREYTNPFQTCNLTPARLLLVVVIIMMIAGCKLAQNPPPPAQSTTPAQEIVFIGDVGSFPTGCGPQEIVEFINRFIAAYNSGDTDGLDQFFDAHFNWYTDGVAQGQSVDPATFFRTSRRDELAEYITLRHAQGDRLRLLEISVAGPGWHDGMDVTFTLAREADDLPTTANRLIRVARGKGMVTCPVKRIYVWNMGTQELGNIPEIVAQDASYNVAFDKLPDKIMVYARNEKK
jgi:hypothetical protein